MATENQKFVVKYRALNGKHTVSIGKTDIKVQVVMCDNLPVKITQR